MKVATLLCERYDSPGLYRVRAALISGTGTLAAMEGARGRWEGNLAREMEGRGVSWWEMTGARANLATHRLFIF